MRRLLAAASAAVALLACATIAQAACSGARPGATVETRVGQCTLNFVLRGSDGRRYIGTAGHCVLGHAGERTWSGGSGPVAKTAAGKRLGHFSFAVLHDARDMDFSLIRLARGVRANPAVCQFGGPTGINRDITSDPVFLDFYGEGVGVSSVMPGRTVLALGMPSPRHVYAQGAAVPGDSGSGVISSDGRAVGVVVTVGLHAGSIGPDRADAGLIGIDRIPRELRAARHALGLGLRLAKAPRA